MCRRCTNQPFTCYFPSRSLNTARLYCYSHTAPLFVNSCQYNHSQERLRGPEEDVYAGENEAEQLEAEEEEEVRIRGTTSGTRATGADPNNFERPSSTHQP